MGADLITSYLWYPGNTEPDWDAGLAAVQALTAEQLQAFDEERGAGHGSYETYDAEALQDLRDVIIGAIEDLRPGEGKRQRDLVTIQTPDGKWKALLTAGMSWGDSPSDSFDVMEVLCSAPGVAQAIGFVFDSNAIRLVLE